MTIDQRLLDDVKEIYRKTGSIRETSKEINLSEQKVRRLLITAGAKIDNPVTIKILSLYKNGLSPTEIAQKLGRTRNAVIAHLPYTKGPMQKWTDEEKQAAIGGDMPATRSVQAVRTLKSRTGHANQRERKDTPLRSLRLKNQLTQADLADLTGLSLSAIRAYEQEKRDISKASFATLNQLAKSLHCKINDLF